MEDRKTLIRGIIIGIAASLLVGSGYNLAKNFDLINGQSLNSASTEKKVHKIEQLISKYYLEDYTEDDLRDSMYKGIAEGLEDKYSVYYTADEYEQLQESSQGQYTGIGVVMQQDKTTGLVTIIKCYEGSPGEKAGLKAGDVIYKIGDEEVATLELEEIAVKIRKSESETVHLTIIRENEEDYLEFDVKKEIVDIPMVACEMEDNKIGYIAISEFSTVCVDQFKKAVEDLQGQGMKKLIVDLRNNPGGYVTAVCDIADMFLDKEQMIVYTEDKQGERVEYKAEEEKTIDLPLVLLVNENSASASEIFAGVVKDDGIGTIVGTNTYGKGIVQSIFNLGDGSALKLTVSKYYTPAGNNIHKIGIAPDVEVELDTTKAVDGVISKENDDQFQKAVEILSE